MSSEMQQYITGKIVFMCGKNDNLLIGSLQNDEFTNILFFYLPKTKFNHYLA